MNTLKLTRSDFDANGKYVGAVDINGYDGNVEIEERLGWCVFVAIKVTGYLRAKAGSGIKAGEGIKAGWASISNFNCSQASSRGVNEPRRMALYAAHRSMAAI